MGRVDEAMRRAAEAARVRTPDAPSDATWPVGFATPSAFAPPPVTTPTPPFVEVSEPEPVPTASVPEATIATGPFPLTGVPPTAVSAVGDKDDDEFGPRAELAAEASALLDRMDPALREKVVVDRNMEPASREQYRRLAATLYHLQADTNLKVLMIASAGPGEGKTLTAVNLSLTLSESYRRSVLLIDADLRRPSLHKAFQVDGSPGLMEGMVAGDDWKIPLHQITPRLRLLTGGKPSTDPMFGLTSARMRTLIEEARETFAWVIVDTPPVGLLTDANLLATMVDGAVLVVKAGETSYDQVRRAIDALGPGKLLGVVLNRATERSTRYGYDYARYYLTPPQG
jgi:capsular exopolysaccharide synthesis family protein